MGTQRNRRRLTPEERAAAAEAEAAVKIATKKAGFERKIQLGQYCRCATPNARCNNRSPTGYICLTCKTDNKNCETNAMILPEKLTADQLKNASADLKAAAARRAATTAASPQTSASPRTVANKQQASPSPPPTKKAKAESENKNRKDDSESESDSDDSDDSEVGLDTKMQFITDDGDDRPNEDDDAFAAPPEQQPALQQDAAPQAQAKKEKKTAKDKVLARWNTAVAANANPKSSRLQKFVLGNLHWLLTSFRSFS